MSYRNWVFASTGACLLIALVFGAALIFWRASHSVEIELNAATISAADSVRHAVTNLHDQSPSGEEAVVSSFDGQRHVEVFLVDTRERTIAASRMANAQNPAPVWFERLIAPAPLVFGIPVPGFSGNRSGAILVESNARNEVSEVWGQARDTFTTMVLYCAILLATMLALASRALSFLSGLNAAFEAVPNRHATLSLPEKGFREFAAAAREFNRMTRRLRELEEKTERLQHQLQIVQDEERTDIARDLHDEVGPHLFAISVDIASLSRIAVRGDMRAIDECSKSMLASINHVQKHIKSILRQLTPLTAVEFGLESALADLLAFWKPRASATSFTLHCAVDEAQVSARVKETVYRIVQEGVGNAIRHGSPSAVNVTVRQDRTEILITVCDDGNGAPAPIQKGLGLNIVLDRVRALSGRASFAANNGQKGLTLSASLPIGEFESLCQATP